MSQMPLHTLYNQMTDEELVRYSLHDENAFYILMKRYEPALLRYINRIMQASREEAEDLLQEIFIKVYRNINGFDINLKFSTWLYRIAHNEVISQYRKNRRYRSSLNIDDAVNDSRLLVNFLTDTFNMESDYLVREMGVEVKKVLEKLAPKYRDVLVLRYLEELSYEEISDIIQKPSGSVATLLNRAKEKFKKLAEQYQLERK
ncbi:MAG: sigma-70 family RNA polymerase sigma factor [Desulfatiglans sp.]|jgi:RNA polymerase sigma-70 factor (ECF subfamily)|nr:sigma-70 family RNA polymerase sigma factor [Desulfatiglans sp.]